MPIQTYPEGYPDAVAPFAAAVARHLDGELDGLVLAVEFPQVSSLIGDALVDVSAMIGEAKARARAGAAALSQALQAAAAAAGVPLRCTEAKSVAAMFGDTVAAQARYHDFVVLGCGANEPAFADTAEVAVFGTGKPVLLVPPEAPAPSFGHIMVAWDGSRAAARAVADAREFLDRAKAISIVSVTDDKPVSASRPAARLAEYLSRSGKSPGVDDVEGGDRPIAEVLQGHAREEGADLLVMGAFGHSRLRDFVLGGATRGILRDLRVPVLLSH